MPRLTKIYTRTGDDGETGLGSGARVRKDHPRVEAYGAVDELNAVMGVVLAAQISQETAAALREIQNELFHAGADLCIPESEKPSGGGPRVETRHTQALETLIDRLNGDLPPLENFVLPGGTPAAAWLHVARTVCRRAEREVLRLAASDAVNPEILRYLNRLSDALFVLSRHENRVAGVAEPVWDSRA